MAHDYQATIRWSRGDAAFTDGRYSRGHVWAFDGIEVPGSSDPKAVRPPLSREDAIDPEEALVAAASSCQMLYALDFARKAGFTVDSYEDAAEGVMTKNEQGKNFISKITLNPTMVFSGDKVPTTADVEEIHHKAHGECIVAYSLRAEIVIVPRFSVA